MSDTAARAREHEHIVLQAMNHHNKHYWCLVRNLRARRKGWGELADLIGEGSTVAQAIWNKYIDMEAPSDELAAQSAVELKTDTLFGVYCSGNPESIPKDRAIFWEGWQRVADYVNRELRQHGYGAQGQGVGWVSVEDRLPEDSEIVLLFQRDGIASVTTFGVRDKGKWLDYNNTTDDYPNEIRKITHWQPLPAAPAPSPGSATPLHGPNCGADRSGPSAEAHSENCPESATKEP